MPGGGGVRVNVTTPSWLTATTLTAASSIAATSVSELKTLGRANIFPALPPAREHHPKQTHTSIHQRCVGVREEEETGKKRKKAIISSRRCRSGEAIRRARWRRSRGIVAIFKIGRHNSISLGNKILTIFHLDLITGCGPGENCILWG